MNATLGALWRLRQFASAMSSNVSPVDLALPAARALLASTGLPFKIVGGVAVVHHGYLRTTDDVDALVDARSPDALSKNASAHGFVVETRTRLRHASSGVLLDLLVAGEAMPRPGSPPYPDPARLSSSATDPAIIGLAPLFEMKLSAHRHRDIADVVELLKGLAEGSYLDAESAMPPELRRELSDLRRDALEERAMDDSSPRGP